MPDLRFLLPCALLTLVAPVFPEVAGDPLPPLSRGLPIMFLPPPIEGTISVGIYNGAGKIVRSLHRESEQTEFTVSENGLLTRWDGNDDAGKPLPPERYHVKGWMVGDLAVEGLAFHGNDWIKDGSPRYSRVKGVTNAGRDEVRVTLLTADGKEEVLSWKLAKEGVELPKSEIETAVEDGALLVRKGGSSLSIPLGEGAKAIASVVGNGDRVWTIVETPGGREVRAYSALGEFLRRLGYQKDEPQPQQLAASLWDETIFLLDENAAEQRLRALALGASDRKPPAPAGEAELPAGVSAWRITYLKRVLKMDSFESIAGQLGRKDPLTAAAFAKVEAQANPLLGDGKPQLALKVSCDARGAVLMTADDLHLVHLTHTPNLKWAVLVKEGPALLLFQCDGTVVEEFAIRKPGNMMSFDAGGYDLKAPGKKSDQPRLSPALAPKRKLPVRSGDDL